MSLHKCLYLQLDEKIFDFICLSQFVQSTTIRIFFLYLLVLLLKLHQSNNWLQISISQTDSYCFLKLKIMFQSKWIMIVIDQISINSLLRNTNARVKHSFFESFNIPTPHKRCFFYLQRFIYPQQSGNTFALPFLSEKRSLFTDSKLIRSFILIRIFWIHYFFVFSKLMFFRWKNAGSRDHCSWR